MKEALKVVFVFLTTMVLFAACDKDEDYPIIPSIELKSTVFQADPNNAADTVIVTLYIRDGDGDIGKEDGTGCPSPEAHDIICEYEELVSNEWLETDEGAEWCVRSLTPIGKDRTLEGDLIIKIPLAGNTFDSLRFQILIQDRAGHQSNKVASPLITP